MNMVTITANITVTGIDFSFGVGIIGAVWWIWVYSVGGEGCEGGEGKE
jgi:hypothetical protein